MKKAKEYYELYKYDLMSDDGNKAENALLGLFKDFSAEVQELSELRHVQIDRGILPIMKEMNQKWNAIVRLFEKDYGLSPIKRDGFKNFWVYKMPELNGKI